jgi:ABC-type uncharacterized transport system involved in gliding motility auxiliary subunit
MKTPTKRYNHYMKFVLYAAIVVLLNLAGRTMFERIDLTANKAFTLSDVSKQVVRTLSEPLTVKVFFTKKLPPPNNNTELYLQDLLNEYAIHGNRHFNYTFYDVSSDTEGIGEKAKSNREMARNYGINPIQIQMVENDEIKFQQAYMGLVMIHGDIIERIQAITTTEGLEYKLTSAMQKLNNKVSALLNLKDNIHLDLVLSSSLLKVAPYVGLNKLEQYPDDIKEIVDQLNSKMYGKLSYNLIDPDKDPDAAKAYASQDLMALKWPATPQVNLEEGSGTIGLVARYQDDIRSIPLLSVLQLPLIGTQYQLAEPQQVEEMINVNVERMMKINEDLGYISDFGAPALQNFGPSDPRSPEALNSFNAVAGTTYNLKSVPIKDTPIPDGLKCLIIANPTEPLSDYALYQIDQALMRGTNLAIFVDAFKEGPMPGRQPMMAGQSPSLIPFDSGLEKLLEHYGVRIKKSLIMDEECYRQRLPQRQGGGEQALYFAPIIQTENINDKLDFIKDIRGLIAYKISPLELVSKQIEDQGVTAHQLFASSGRSWEMRDRISLNPMFLRPPASDSEMASQPLAYLLEGSFTSYFKGKPMPEKPADETDENAAGDEAEPESDEPKPADDDDKDQKMDLSAISSEGAFREQSPPAKIFVAASSELIKDSLLRSDETTINTVFVMNILDVLNDKEDVAVMRGKKRLYNPLEQTTPTKRGIIKAFNIVGLPVIVIIFGIAVWFYRYTRRKRIQSFFQHVETKSPLTTN